MLKSLTRIAAISVALLAIASLVSAAGEFRNCGQTNFCYRNRGREPTSYEVSGVRNDIDTVYFDLLDVKAAPGSQPAPLRATVQLSGVGTVNLRVKEDDVVTKRKGERYDATNEIKSGNAPDPHKLEIVVTSDSLRACAQKSDMRNCVEIDYKTFRLTHFILDEVVSIVNGENLFNFEQHRDRIPSDTEEMWKETWDGWTDTKLRGPASLSLDVSFPRAGAVYGLPEHTTGIALKSTRGPHAAYDEPYRLYNLDAYGHPIDSPGPVYGSVPFIMSHSLTETTVFSAGAFLLNPSEMFIDVDEAEGGKGYSTHWMVETGAMNLYLFGGVSPMMIQQQYMLITGLPVMPPLFSMAYHQCRWNYDSQDDVLDVNSKFDSYKIPYDVIWLDIDHTDRMKYFTWNPEDFSDPINMQNKLASTGRHLVNIVDPHIKVDPDYYVYHMLTELDAFVRDGANNTFEGDCWPGRSSWADFVRPDVRDQWAKFFALKSYAGSTTYLHIWNDMNEPSVFTGPEKTLPKDALHDFGSLEHRDIHNMYGYLYNLASSIGLYRRQIGAVGIPDKVTPPDVAKGSVSVTPVPGAAVEAQRPFLLTRSFFAGSQRIGAVWTGDNQASWDYLKYSHRMLLSLGVGGITFAGADVGGFAGNPSAELVERWYQSASFVPFFRAHSSNDTARREPWSFDEPSTSRIRSAIRRRYDHLAYINTQFRVANTTGIPAMRALIYDFPTDPEALKYDDAYMMGSSMMIVPVVEPGKTSVSAYLPMEVNLERSVWYDVRSYKKVSADRTTSAAAEEEECPMARAAREAAGIPAPARSSSKKNAKGYVTLDAPADYSPILYRGGRVIPTQPTPGVESYLSSSAMSTAPITLIAALTNNFNSRGHLYLDDGSSFDFMDGNYINMGYDADVDAVEATKIVFTARKGALPAIVPIVPSKHNMVSATPIAAIRFLGMPANKRVTSATATITGTDKHVKMNVDETDGVVTVYFRPDVPVYAHNEFVATLVFDGAMESQEEGDATFAAAVEAVSAGGLRRRLGLDQN